MGRPTRPLPVSDSYSGPACDVNRACAICWPQVAAGYPYADGTCVAVGASPASVVADHFNGGVTDLPRRGAWAPRPALAWVPSTSESLRWAPGPAREDQRDTKTTVDCSERQIMERPMRNDLDDLFLEVVEGWSQEVLVE